MAESSITEDASDFINKHDTSTSLEGVHKDLTLEELNGKQKDTSTNTGDTPKDIATNTKAKSATEMGKKSAGAAAAKSMATKPKPETTSPAKASSAAPTASKKPLSSSTSTSSAVKPTVAAKHATTATTATPSPKTANPASPERKAVTSPTQSLVKPAVARSSITTATATHSRRASLAPSTASSTSLAKASTTSTSRPPSVSSVSKGPVATPTSSVVSPALNTEPRGSTPTARPRATVSDGVLPKKTVSSSRPSLSSNKLLSTSATSSGKATATIPEVNEEVQDLKGKIKSLEETIESVTADLSAVQVERDGKNEQIKTLEESTAALDAELKHTVELLESIKNEKESADTELIRVRQELKSAMDLQSAKLNDFNALQEQFKSVEAQVAAAEEALTMAREAHEKALGDSSAQYQEQLVETQATLKASSDELVSLREVYGRAQEEAANHSTNLRFELEKSVALSAEIDALKRTKEDIESKLAESEVEVLELKESLEQESDRKSALSTRLITLQEELDAARESNQAATAVSQAKDKEYDVLLTKLSGLEAQLTEALGNLDAMQSALAAKEEAHALELVKIQQMHEEANLVTAEELRRIKEDLEGQEAKYAKQLEEARIKHAELLEQAFQNAKNEAGETHSQELQALRLQSQSAIEQLRQAHQTSLDDIKAIHEETLQTEVKALEKQISTLTLDLKVTREDLAKAKASLDSSALLENSLRNQLEEKEKELASAKLALTENVQAEQLSRELENAKAELASRTEDFTAFKESFQQIVVNHQTELEEAAKGHTEEVIKLKDVHVEQEASFKRDREELASRISELEVELATLKASVADTTTTVTQSTPRKDTNGTATMITKEELQRVHEAHSLKVYEMESAHLEAVKTLTEKLEIATTSAEEQRAHAERLQMELTFTENSAEDMEDELKQLKQEVEHLKAMQQVGDTE